MIIYCSLNDAGLPPPLEGVYNMARTKAYNPHEVLTPRSCTFLEATINSYFDKLMLATKDGSCVEETASSTIKKCHEEGAQSQG